MQYDDIECTLPKMGEKCTLECFADLGQAQQIEFKKGYEIDRNNRLLEMKQNPQAFFNFKFTPEDYYLFLVKYSMMRAERRVIEQEYTKFLEKNKIKLE